MVTDSDKSQTEKSLCHFFQLLRDSNLKPDPGSFAGSRSLLDARWGKLFKQDRIVVAFMQFIMSVWRFPLVAHFDCRIRGAWWHSRRRSTEARASVTYLGGSSAAEAESVRPAKTKGNAFSGFMFSFLKGGTDKMRYFTTGGGGMFSETSDRIMRSPFWIARNNFKP
jgi:hypothetical protein